MRSVLTSMLPGQWTQNLYLFGPLAFAARFAQDMFRSARFPALRRAPSPGLGGC